MTVTYFARNRPTRSPPAGRRPPGEAGAAGEPAGGPCKGRLARVEPGTEQRVERALARQIDGDQGGGQDRERGPEPEKPGPAAGRPAPRKSPGNREQTRGGDGQRDVEEPHAGVAHRDDRVELPPDGQRDEHRSPHRANPDARQPSGPTSRASGEVRMAVERIHRPEGLPCARRRSAIPTVTKAPMAETSATATARSPRFTQPNRSTGVK